MNRIDKVLFISLAVFISIIHLYAYRVWLFSGGVLTDGDWFLSLPEHSRELFSLPSMWMTYVFGSVNLTPPFYPFMLFEGILSSMGIPYSLIERITFMWPIALFTMPFIYLLIKSITKNNIASLVGAVVYAYNTYFIIIQTGHLTLMMGFTLAPLALFLFMKALERRSYFFSVLTGLLIFIISFFEFRSFFLVALICFLYYLYHLIFQKKQSIIFELKRTILIAIIPLGITLLLNIYWILPMLKVSSIVTSSVYNREFFGNEFFNIIRSLTLFHPFWTGGEVKAFIVQNIPLYFYITPVLAFIGLYVNRKNKKVIFFGLLAIIGIFLSKQNNPPLADMYSFLYYNIPGFGAFREASKFYFIAALSYAVLIAAFVSWLLQVKTKKQRFLYGKYLVVILLVGMYSFNMKPLITGEIGTLFAKKEMPADYIILNTFLAKQPDYFRTAWLPNDSRWSPHTDLHPKISIAAALAVPWAEQYELKTKLLGTQYIDFVRTPIGNAMLDAASVKYIIVPLQDKYNNDDFYNNYGRMKEDYIRALDTSQYYERLSIGTKQIVVYKNSDMKPHIYLTQQPESLSEKIPFEKVDFEVVNATEYHLKVRLSKPSYIQFSETYHPDWNLYPADFQWIDLLSKNTLLSTENKHKKNESQFNSFYIDPQQICSKVSCERDKENNYIIDMILFFTPQGYMYMGSIISTFTGIIVTFWLSILCFKNLHYAKNR